MPIPLPSPGSARPHSQQKAAPSSLRPPSATSSIRRPPSATSTRTTAIRTQQSTVTSQLNPTKIRAGLEKENDANGKTTAKPARRQSNVNVPVRGKPPSKDGTAQRTAKEVEGLKDYVSISSRTVNIKNHGYEK